MVTPVRPPPLTTVVGRPLRGHGTVVLLTQSVYICVLFGEAAAMYRRPVTTHFFRCSSINSVSAVEVPYSLTFPACLHHNQKTDPCCGPTQRNLDPPRKKMSKVLQGVST